MPTSVAEQIAVVVKTRLGLISTANSYETTTTGVIRPTQQGGFQPKDYQIVLTQDSIERVEELSHPGNPPATCWQLPFVIAGIMRQSESDTTSMDTLKNEFWADVIKAITNATPWHTFGGNAINAEISQVEDYRSDDGTATGFFVRLTVWFRTDEDDPYTVRA